MEYRYIEVLHCGQVTPQEASYFSDVIDNAECSYVANAVFTYEFTYECGWDPINNEPTYCSHSDTNTYDVATPMSGNMDADQVCTKRFAYSDDGETEYYSSQLIFCADVIQMAFIACM